MRLLAHEVHQGVLPLADLVELGGHSPQLALGAHVVEVHREGAEKLLGHEVDGPDVGVEEAGDIALEQVGVGDVDAAQPELHVEGGREALVQCRIRLDDVHPAADLRQVVGVDHRLPLVGGALDLRILELPGEHILDEVVGRCHVARLADGLADGLVALETHQQELVVALAEEAGEAGQDGVHVHVPFGGHELPHHAQQVHHDLVLPVAEGVILEEVQADGEAVFDVVDAEHLVDRPVEKRGEGREVGGEQLLFRRRLGSADEFGHGLRSQLGEAGGDRRLVGQFGLGRRSPRGQGQPLGQQPVAQQQQRAEQTGERGLQRRALGGLAHQVMDEGVALQEGKGPEREFAL